LRYGGILYDIIAINLLLSLLVKEFEKWPAFGKLTGKNRVVQFVRTRCCINYSKKLNSLKRVRMTVAKSTQLKQKKNNKVVLLSSTPIGLYGKCADK